jgi:membrane protease YdiL (CAAX protease family)
MTLDQAELVRPVREQAPLSAVAVAAYAALIVAAEASIAYWDVSVGAVVDGALVLVLVNRFLFATGRPRERTASGDAALALALIPLLRLLSLSMTVEDVSPVARNAVVGAPLLAATLVGVFAGPFESVAFRLSAPSWRVQAPIGLLGIPLGALAFLVAGRPAGLTEGRSLVMLALAAFVVVVFTGFGEELLFRGVLQDALTPIFGGGSPAVAALIFGSTYLAAGSARYAGFATLVGFGFGWLVRRTGSLLGVSIAHGLMNVGLLLAWPLLAQ